ncbi:MAG TPA: Fic family protein [Woeseiaceae bacterium]|nr:Fic family protein [Woeseiaceae bacterium]
MRRQELAGALRQPYSPARGFGLAKVGKPGYENIWFVVPPKPPRRLSESPDLRLLREANLALQARPPMQSASELEQTTAFLLINREAVSSSRMEGTWSTIDDVLSPIQGDRSAAISVRGYASALVHAFNEVRGNGLAALTPGLLCGLHERFMAKDPHFRGIAGRLRAPGLPGDVVQIGSFGRREESIYNPAPPAQVASCLGDVLDWMRDESLAELGDAGMGLSLPIRMAIGHAHFEAVHPFSDGNGRVGRMLWAIQMAASGILPLYLSGYVEVNKDEYGAALAEAQKQLSYRRIVAFVCRAIVVSSDEESETQQVLQSLPVTWQQRGAFRRGSSASRALELLARRPIVTVKELAARLNVSTQAANEAVRRLEHAGVVRERSGRGRGKVYAAEEAISVLARSFGSDPEIALEGARNLLTTESRQYPARNGG